MERLLTRPILLSCLLALSFFALGATYTAKQAYQSTQLEIQKKQEYIDKREQYIKKLEDESEQLKCNPFYEEGDPLLGKPLCNLDARTSQGYGQNLLAYGGMGLSGHPGVDFVDDEGAPVRASHSGVVFSVNTTWSNELDGKTGYGRFVKIRQRNGSNGFETVYAHLHDVAVEEGDVVRAGQFIGTLGNTGFSTRPHLHFGIRFLYYCDKGTDIGHPCEVLNGGNGMMGWVDPVPYLHGKKQI